MKKFNGYANSLAFFLAAFLAFGLFVGCKEAEPEPAPPKEYMVTYILDDSIANEDSLKNIVLPKNGKVEENTVVTLESLTVTGWTFDGWFVDNQKVNTTDYKIVKDTNFVAKFTKIKTPTESGSNTESGGDNDNNDSGDGDSSGGTGSGSEGSTDDETQFPLVNGLYMFDQEMNPEYSSRTEALDTIFNPDELGEIVLVIDRSEWNKHLDYCDYDLKHEDSVKAKGFYFKKDNKQWFFKDIGFRIRGNTSRLRPQEKKSDGTNGKYVQAHFALDFEEWITDEQDEAGVEKKLANSMKGLILKRANNDSTYVREIYGYNLFRKNGIWIAPRAAFTTLKIQIVDDLDLDKDGDRTEFETVNYGVYGMVEEIKKQFLKERIESGTLQSNKGNLWKCTWQKENGANFVYSDASSKNVIGEEDVHFDFDKNGKITNFTREVYNYDYKGDKKLADGKTQLLNFMKELNELPDCTDGKNDASDIETIKSFYTNKMDGDLFLRTYAINVILGMWDDYWINKNNFYFYFDSDDKAYFIPYDYDNILGTNGCNTDAGMKNPLNWGSLTDGDHPLIQKILQVPEYMDVYKKYLLEYSNENSLFDDDKSIAMITNWHNMFKDYIASDDLAYYSKLEDKPASWGEPYVPYTVYTPGNNNYFTVRQKVIQACVNPSDEKLTLTLNAGNGSFSSGSKTLNYEFTEGTTLAEIFESNDFDGWTLFTDNDKFSFYDYLKYSYEKNGVYYYPWCFIDSEGNEIYEDNLNQITLYEDTTLNTLYKKYVPITFDGNVLWDGFVEYYLFEEFDIAELGVPETEDYLCIGWTLTPDGNDFVTKVPSEPVTLYAKWISKDEIVLPYEFSEDFSKITFIFRPSDYNVSLSSSTNYNVYLMSSFTLPEGWPESACSEDNRLVKGNDGIYRLTIDSIDVYHNWHGFQFCVKGVQWCGPNQYNQIITPENIGGDNNDCFMVTFPEPTITFDLNGGTPTSYLEDSYSTDGRFNWTVTDFYRNFIGDNPTKDGFAFAGWTLTKDGDGIVDRIPFGKITVYAKWIEIREHTLTLISDENSWFVKDDVRYEELELTFTTGQTFNEIRNNNWFYVNTEFSEDGSYSDSFYDEAGNEIYSDSLLIEDTIVCVKTKFIPYVYISLTLNANGGVFEDDSDTLVLRIPEGWGIGYAPSKDGCIFKHWTLANSTIVEQVTDEIEGQTLYAEYLDVFTNADIIGNMTDDSGESLTKIDDNTYSYTFTYSLDMTGPRETTDGQVAFKLRPNSIGDGTEFGCDNTPSVDGGDYWCGQGYGNINVYGLEDGIKYTITFKTGYNAVYVNIASVSAPEPAPEPTE